MFWEIFLKLCNKNNESPNNVCNKLKLSNATATKWKNGSVPHNATLLKIAEYFGVTVEYLLGETDIKEKASVNGSKKVIGIDFGTTYTTQDTKLIAVTAEEEQIMEAYRKQPEVARTVVRRALGLEGISPDAATAAYGGKNTQTGKKME